MNASTRTPFAGPGWWLAVALIVTGAAVLGFTPLFGGTLLAGGIAGLFVDTRRAGRAAAHLAESLTAAETDCRRQAAELAETRARYLQVLEHAQDAMFYVSPHDGRLLEVNRRAEEMLGYSCEEVRQLTLDSLFPGRHRRRFLKLVRNILAAGHGEASHLQLRRKDGSIFYGDLQARLGQVGTQPVVHGSIRDVTPNVQLAAELRRHNQHLELLNEIALRLSEGRSLSSVLATILAQVVDSLAVDGGGIFLLRHRNSEMELAFHQGIPAEVTAELATLKPGMGLAGHVAATCRPRLSVDLVHDRRRVCVSVTTDGWRAFLAVPLLTDEGCCGVLFVFSRGLRELQRNDLRLLQAIGRQLGPLVRKAELFDELQWQHRLNQASLRELERSRATLRENFAQLEQQHRMLQSLERMKSNFLSLASHELRTPLTAIWSGAELLQARTAGQLDEAGRCALSGILHGSRRLRDVVDDLLEAARLEAKAVYLAREDFDLLTLFEELVGTFQPVCDQRRLTCSIGALPERITVRGDLYHLRRALGRLLENAVKFTPEGGWVRLDAALHSAAAVEALAGRLRRFSTGFFEAPRAPRYLEIRISDNGVGLAPGEEEQIFSRFFTGDDIASHSTSRERFGGKGVGLGLPLARGLIAAHDGMLWAESAGRSLGSSFCMLLPLPPAEAACDDA